MVDWFRRFSEIPGVTFARAPGHGPDKAARIWHCPRDAGLRLLDTTRDTRVGALWNLLVYTGMRPGEVWATLLCCLLPIPIATFPPPCRSEPWRNLRDT